jgi:hypothetical protein
VIDRRWLWCLLVAFGCSSDQPPPPGQALPTRDPSAPIQTDTTTYALVRDSLGWEARMALRFTNTSPDTLYAVNCNGALTLAVERQSGAGWDLFWAPLTNACLSPPLVIPPGGSYQTPWSIWGAPPGTNVGPQFADMIFDDTYRLVWWNLLAHYDTGRRELGDSVSLEYRRSNEFLLR